MNKNNNEGIIKLIVLAVVAILILSYFRVDLRSVVQNETFQKNIFYLENGIKNVWNNFIDGPVAFLWNLITRASIFVLSEIEKIAPK